MQLLLASVVLCGMVGLSLSAALEDGENSVDHYEKKKTPPPSSKLAPIYEENADKKTTTTTEAGVVVTTNSQGLGEEDDDDSSVDYYPPSRAAGKLYHYAMNGYEVRITFTPARPMTLETKTIVLKMHINGTFPKDAHLGLDLTETMIAGLPIENRTIPLPEGCVVHCEWTYDIAVSGRRLGRAFLLVTLHHQNHSSLVVPDYEVVVMRAKGVHDQIYWMATVILLVIVTFAFGCQVDIKILKEILKKPIPPAIGFFCQFGMMPLIGFGLAKAFSLEGAFGFGVLVYACAPGGGMSNAWTNVLDGDVTLSLTMTFVSTMCSLGMMPLWIWALGRFFVDPAIITIPYMNIFKNLLLLTVPCIAGTLFRRYLPRAGKTVVYLNKYFSHIFVLYHVVYGNYVNYYVYVVTAQTPIIFALGLALPFCGYTMGAVIALLLKQERSRVITIAIETGIQNVGVPIVILLVSFPRPEGDLGAVIPICVANITIIATFIASIVHNIKKQINARRRLRRKELSDMGEYDKPDPIECLEIGNGSWEKTDNLGSKPVIFMNDKKLRLVIKEDDEETVPCLGAEELHNVSVDRVLLDDQPPKAPSDDKGTQTMLTAEQIMQIQAYINSLSQTLLPPPPPEV